MCFTTFSNVGTVLHNVGSPYSCKMAYVMWADLGVSDFLEMGASANS